MGCQGLLKKKKVGEERRYGGQKTHQGRKQVGESLQKMCTKVLVVTVVRFLGMPEDSLTTIVSKTEWLISFHYEIKHCGQLLLAT